MTTPAERRALRREMRTRRRALGDAERRVAASSLAKRLAVTGWFRNSRTVAVYLANDGEIDLAPLVKRAWAMGKRTYLPRLFGPKLWFLPFHARSEFAGNRFSIPEPRESARRRIHPLFLDLVLFPLVAFDRHGNRLGMGAGYYDRTFAAVRRRTAWQGPKRIGVAYEIQQVDALDAAHWDIALDAIVTDRAIRIPHRGPSREPGLGSGGAETRLQYAPRVMRTEPRSDRTMRYWLMKTEPNEFGIDDLAECPDQTEPWDGVRNYQARNMMRDEMKKGDGVFVYHSNCDVPGIVGIARISREGYPDPTAFDPQDRHYDPASDPENPRWFLVDVKFERKLRRTIPLAELKAQATLEGMALVRRGNRLSVMPVSAPQWKHILSME